QCIHRPCLQPLERGYRKPLEGLWFRFCHRGGVCTGRWNFYAHPRQDFRARAEAVLFDYRKPTPNHACWKKWSEPVAGQCEQTFHEHEQDLSAGAIHPAGEVSQTSVSQGEVGTASCLDSAGLVQVPWTQPDL